MPRFVILWHHWPACPRTTLPFHWDLMFESAGRLATWGLESVDFTHLTAPATQLPDHRLEYLDYQGAISGDRGSVSRVVSGRYQTKQWLRDTPATFHNAAQAHFLGDADQLLLSLFWQQGNSNCSATIQLLRNSSDHWNLKLDPNYDQWTKVFSPTP